MPRAYSEEAREYCFKLYLKYNGQQHERVEEEMRRKGWVGWSRQNLYTRGKGKNLKVGWIERFGWEKALALKIEADARRAAGGDSLLADVQKRRARLSERLDREGEENRDLVYQHLKYAELEASLTSRAGAGRDDLQSFVVAWERLLEWAAKWPRLLTALVEFSEQVMERAKAEYGETAR